MLNILNLLDTTRSLQPSWDYTEYFFQKANQEVFFLGVLPPSEKPAKVLIAGKLVTYRLLSIPAALLAMIQNVAFNIFMGCYRLTFMQIPLKEFSHQAFVISLYHIHFAGLVIVKTIQEIFQTIKILWNGSYQTSAIFSEKEMPHFYDGEVIERAFQVKAPDFIICVDGHDVPFHREVLEQTGDYFKTLVSGPMSAAKLGIANKGIEVSYPVLLAFRRFIYTGFATDDFTMALEIIRNLQPMYLEDDSAQSSFILLMQHCQEVIEKYLEGSLVIELLEKNKEQSWRSKFIREACFNYHQKYPSKEFFEIIKQNRELENFHKKFLNDQKWSLKTSQKTQEKPTYNFPISKKIDVTFTLKNQNSIQASRLMLGVHSSFFFEYFKDYRNDPELEIDLVEFEVTKQTLQDFLDVLKGSQFLPLNEPKEETYSLLFERWKSLFAFVQTYLADDPVVKPLKVQFQKQILPYLEHLNDQLLMETQRLAGQLKLSKIVNLCLNKRIHNILSAVAKGQPFLKDIVKLFDEDCYWVTHLDLAPYFNLYLNAHNEIREEESIFNRIRIEHVQCLLECVKKTCPFLKHLILTSTTSLIDEEFKKLFQKLIHLKTICIKAKYQEDKIISRTDLFNAKRKT